MDIESQSAQILAYLREGNSLTPIDALQRFGCFRLGARVWDLKRDGHDIRTELVDVGGGKRVARYYLAGQMTMFPQMRTTDSQLAH
jgi:hypothetical protein